MKIIKTAQLAGLLGKGDHLHGAVDDARHDGNPDVGGANTEITLEGDIPHVGQDDPLDLGGMTHDLTNDLQEGNPVDIGIELDPTNEEHPLELDIDGHELPLDTNHPDLNLDQVGDDVHNHTGQFDEMSLDGDLDGTLHMDEAIGGGDGGGDLGGGGGHPMDDAHAHELGGSHHMVDDPNAGIDGLIVLDDGPMPA